MTSIPDLPLAVKESSAANSSNEVRTDGGRQNRDITSSAPKRKESARKGESSSSFLNGHNSRALRDKLLEEITVLNSAEAALAWAIRRIGTKNNLGAEDATIVDRAFKDRTEILAPEVPLGSSPCKPTSSLERIENPLESDPPNTQQPVVDAEAPAAVAPALGNHQGLRPNSRDESTRLVLVKAAPLSRQGSLALHCYPALYDLWPAAVRSSPHPLRPAPCIWTTGLR